MNQKIFVDELNADKSIGITRDEDSILRNLIVLDRLRYNTEEKQFYKPDPDDAGIFSKGRYVCMFVKEEKQMILAFVDFEVNHELVSEIFDWSKSDIKMIEKFINATKEVEKNYTDYTEGIDLVVGKP